MTDSGRSHTSDKLARTVSAIFHPILIPVYGMIFILTAPTLYNYIPLQVKKLLILIIMVNNVLLPLSLLPFFMHRKVISSWIITERKDRNIPLIISTILYIVTTYILFRLPIPFFLKTYFTAVTFLSLTATLINFVWKISLHAIGAGIMMALVLILSFRMYTPLIWFILPAILAGGLILTSRLKLNMHNPWQVWMGYFTGFLGFSTIVLLIQQYT